MKKLTVALAAIVFFAIASAFTFSMATDRPAQVSGEHIIIRWDPNGKIGKNVIEVSYGESRYELVEVKKDISGSTNAVIDLLNKFSKEGYTLVGSTSVPTKDGLNTSMLYTLKK